MVMCLQLWCGSPRGIELEVEQQLANQQACRIPLVSVLASSASPSRHSSIRFGV